MADKLTGKQWAFVLAYVQHLNGTEAAAAAQYRGNRATLAAIASENLRKPKIRAAIDELLKAHAMSADEVLSRLSDQARGVPSDCFVTPSYDPEFDTRRLFGVDFERLREYGLLHLIKKVSYDKDGLPTVELYDAQSALVQLGKYHNLFVERQEHTGAGGGPIKHQVTGLEDLSDDDLDAILHPD